MKIKNYDVIRIMNTLNHFSSKKLPQKISYAITRNLVNVSEEYSYYEKSLNKIFNKYKDYISKDENGNIKYRDNGIPVVSNDVLNDFNSEVGELLNIEIDISLFYIPEDTFDYQDEDKKYDAMSAKDIIVLENILCESK